MGFHTLPIRRVNAPRREDKVVHADERPPSASLRRVSLFAVRLRPRAFTFRRSCCRHEARDIVRHAVGAGEQDAVLFAGQGTAAALRTLLRHLDLSKSTVVFVGPFEHHANLRPWRELDVKVRQPADKFTWKSRFERSDKSAAAALHRVNHAPNAEVHR